VDSEHPLSRLLWNAAHDRFPPADGGVEVVSSPPGRSDAVVAFTAHSVVAAGVEPGEALQRLPADDLGAPMGPTFLSWLGEWLDSPPGMIDLVMVAVDDGGTPAGLRLVEAREAIQHPRVARSSRYRTEVIVYTDPEERGVVTIGRGLCDRLEVAVEIDPAHRGQGLGRDLARAARATVPAEEPLFAQVTPGNIASLRAFLAAGYRPIGSEVLFLRR
jgi:GNAT superfamily N-acetyltransferase